MHALPDSGQTPCTSERASCVWRFVLRDRLPAVAEAAESVEAPLCESYWWFDGLNFNRPVMCSVGISCHVKHGPSVRVYFAEETPASGFDAAHFADRSFRMWGPVKLPTELSSQNDQDQRLRRAKTGAKRTRARSSSRVAQTHMAHDRRKPGGCIRWSNNPVTHDGTQSRSCVVAGSKGAPLTSEN